MSDIPNESALRVALRELEEQIGVPPDFLISLHKEDDWSFVIKLHALIESAISHLLTQVTGLEQCSSIFAQLPLSEKKTGKIAWVKSLDLLDDDMRRFISTLSEVRNDLVHNVKNVRFDLKTYAQTLSKDRRANLVNALFHGHTRFIEPLPDNASHDDVLMASPKLMLWANTTLLMTKIWIVSKSANLNRKESELDKTRLAKLDELLSEMLEKPSA